MASSGPITPHNPTCSRSGVYRAARAGRVVRIARGIYMPSDGPPADWDLVEAATRRPEATVCLLSALAHHDLTDAIPHRLDVAIPRGTRRPATEQALTWHLFDGPTFETERTEMRIPNTDLTIGIYSAERCIADAYRLRSRIGYEIARDALKEWLRRGGKPGSLLKTAAALPRSKAPVARALEALA